MGREAEAVGASELRRLGVDVLTHQEYGAASSPDSKLLDRTTRLGRALFTFDDDLLQEADARQAAGIEFAGVIFAHLKSRSVTVLRTCNSSHMRRNWET